MVQGSKLIPVFEKNGFTIKQLGSEEWYHYSKKDLYFRFIGFSDCIGEGFLVMQNNSDPHIFYIHDEKDLKSVIKD